MPADREQAPVHEPGHEDGTRDQAEEVAGGAEEDELEGAHGCRARRPGVGDPPGPTRVEEGRMSVHVLGLRGGQAGVKCGVVRLFGKPYGCRMVRPGVGIVAVRVAPSSPYDTAGERSKVAPPCHSMPTPWGYEVWRR